MTFFDLSTITLRLLILTGGVYQLFSFFCVRDFFSRRRSSAGPVRFTPVSILKPMKGLEPEYERNISTFCRQDYPVYEVLLGFSESDDGAAARVAGALIPALPGDVRVVASSRNAGTNRKVCNLQGLTDAARYPLLAISDSDMRVNSSYLRDIVREYYSRDDVGMVTCLYKISDPRSLGAALESLTIALDFMPAVLTARRLEGVTFGLGASMLVSKKALAEIGGLPAIADYLADDYQLGNRIWKRGYTIVVSHVVLETVAGSMSVRDFIRHQIRWARTYRASRPGGFAGYGITHVFPFALLLFVLHGPTALTLSALAAALGLRFALAGLVGSRVMRSRRWIKWLPLLPVKDLAGFGIWAWSFLSSTVSWRGRSYRILKNGRMVEEGR